MSLFKKFFSNKKKLEFFYDKKGIHYFGGEIPNDFIIPENNFLANFQYIGKISNKDKYFNWLPFELNLICPILTDFDYVYLDYSNSNEPKIIYPKNSAEITSAYIEIDKMSKIVYESKTFSIREFEGINEENEFDIFGITGRAHSNFPDEPMVYPKCPVSNRKMKFVAQLFSNRGLETKSKNFVSKSSYEEKINQHMNFWCEGNLKIFIEPKSKVVAYTIQNT
jgi:hypothetical protein